MAGASPFEKSEKLAPAGQLTEQLLTFSRQSPFQSQIVRLNDVIASSEKLLRRLIGEQISLTVNLDPDVAAIKADTNQLEQVLMNLAVNARDAMPNGGCLTITTSLVSAMHAQAGDGHSTSMPCAQLTITDTGIGIPKENQSRIFEPFFTTKAVGKGSGLGLSVVHGIMQQHNGVIRVTSQPNQGTTFTLLFPHLAQCPQPPDRVPPPAAQHGTETILLVEDEPPYARWRGRCSNPMATACSTHPTAVRRYA